MDRAQDRRESQGEACTWRDNSFPETMWRRTTAVSRNDAAITAARSLIPASEARG